MSLDKLYTMDGAAETLHYQWSALPLSYSSAVANSLTESIHASQPPKSYSARTGRNRHQSAGDGGELTGNLFALCFAALLIATPAHSQTISNDGGGHVVSYALKVAHLRRSGEQVRFAGWCASACTLYLGLPASQLCIARGASFAFHRPYGASQKANRQAEAHLMRNYPQWVRAWLAGNGGLTGKIVTMRYSTASKHIRRCK